MRSKAGHLQLSDYAFRGVYTVPFKGAVYVLHAFQKKSKTGIKRSHQASGSEKVG